MRLSFTDGSGNDISVDLPTTWHGMTIGQCIDLYQKDLAQKLEILAGVTPEQYGQLGEDALAAIGNVLGFLDYAPEYTGLDYPKDIGTLTIGQMELAKKCMAETAAHGTFAVLPFLYAIYMMPERIDLLHSFIRGFPKGVADEVVGLPACEVFAPAAQVHSEVSKMVDSFAAVLNREPEPDQLAAGIEKLYKFGFFGALVSQTNGDYQQMQRILATPADVYYMVKAYEAEQNDFAKAYQEVVSASKPTT